MIAEAFAQVSEETGIPVSSLLAYDRHIDVVAARDAAIRTAHASGATRQQIAQFMGRDWSSINHAIRKGAK